MSKEDKEREIRDATICLSPCLLVSLSPCLLVSLSLWLPRRIYLGVEEFRQSGAAFFLVVEDGDQTAPGFDLLRPAAADYDVWLGILENLVFADSPHAAHRAPQRLSVIRRQFLKQLRVCLHRRMRPQITDQISVDVS